MNERVWRLREQSINTKPYITPERALLVTEFYSKHMASQMSAPLRRAYAFKHLLENKAIYIGEDELVVGERGPRQRQFQHTRRSAATALKTLRFSARGREYLMPWMKIRRESTRRR